MIINKCDIWWIKKYGTKKERRALENYYKAQKKKRKKSTKKVQANLKSPKPKKYQRTKITPELKNWIILTLDILSRLKTERFLCTNVRCCPSSLILTPQFGDAPPKYIISC